MRGSEETSRAGRIVAVATLVVSAALFVSALFGIASIDPSGGSSAASPAKPATPASGQTVSLQHSRSHDDCPWRNGAKAHAPDLAS
jgi:hypothetical protein